MIIIPTRVCNTSNCNYCGVYKRDFDFKYFLKLDLKNFKEKIDFLSKKLNDKNLRFFGWEPFLKFEIIKDIIDVCGNKYNYIINTNLTLLDNEKLNFIKQNNISLIVSCNWKIKDHILTRWISKEETKILFRNIENLTKNNINLQVNIVTTNETVQNLRDNIYFIVNKLWAKLINLLPVSYIWWDDININIFKEQLELLKKDIISKNLEINFINKNVNNKVWLFNSEFLIDSDWKIYPSMVVMENFFSEKRKNIEVSDMNKKLSFIKEDFKYYEDLDHEIYSTFINKILDTNFTKIKINDYKINKIFWDFLNTI